MDCTGACHGAAGISRSGQGTPGTLGRVRSRNGRGRVSFFQFVDLGSFSNVWYWILVAALWTRVINAPLGVTLDLVRRAEAGQDGAQSDLEAATRIEVAHRRALHRALGPLRTALWYFVLTVLIGLGIGYGFEPAQAAALILLPLGVVRWLTGRAAARLDAAPLQGAALWRAHLALRWKVQAVGLGAVFLTAIWGMVHNLAMSGL